MIIVALMTVVIMTLFSHILSEDKIGSVMATINIYHFNGGVDDIHTIYTNEAMVDSLHKGL